jgi:hypothetical protein
MGQVSFLSQEIKPTNKIINLDDLKQQAGSASPAYASVELPFVVSVYFMTRTEIKRKAGIEPSSPRARKRQYHESASSSAKSS